MCQQNKVTKHNKFRVVPINNETNKFSHIHMDIVGPLHMSDNFAYLLTMIDRFSNWKEAMPLENIGTKTILDSFLGNWVSRYGVPECLTTDRGGPIFVPHIWSGCMKIRHQTRHDNSLQPKIKCKNLKVPPKI